MALALPGQHVQQRWFGARYKAWPGTSVCDGERLYYKTVVLNIKNAPKKRPLKLLQIKGNYEGINEGKLPTTNAAT